MHIIFIPYGVMDEMNKFIRDMQSQKFPMEITNIETGEKQKVMIQGNLRMLPFGFYDYVFPKESLDAVLTMMNFDNVPYQLPDMYLKLARKMLRVEPIPEFKKVNSLYWERQHIAVIPIGVRYDGEVTETEGEFKGYRHEAI